MTNKTKPIHAVLQLHGGGTLALSQILKCVALEESSGKSIHQLFQTIIADSAGAIVALCLKSMSAKELASLYLNHINSVLPSAKFLVAQPFINSFKKTGATPSRFDRTPLEIILRNALGQTTLGNYDGNLIIGTTNLDAENPLEYALTFGKITSAEGKTLYLDSSTAEQTLWDIALSTSAIPGIMNPHNEHYADRVCSQHPYFHLHRLQTLFPDHQLKYVQMGNVFSRDVALRQRVGSFMGLASSGVIQAHTTHTLISEHFQQASGLLGKEHSISLTTYAPNGNFNPGNNNALQRTRLAVATLEDIDARPDLYHDTIRTLSERTPIKSIQDVSIEMHSFMLPYLTRQKIPEDKLTEDTQAKYPPPDVIHTKDTIRYKCGVMAHTFLVATGDVLAAAFKLAAVKLKPHTESAMDALFPRHHLRQYSHQTGEELFSSPAPDIRKPH